MNVCMYEFMYAKCSETLIFKLLPNGIIFIDFNFHLHQILNKSFRLGHSNPKPDPKETSGLLN